MCILPFLIHLFHVNRGQIAVISNKQENMTIKSAIGNSKNIVIQKKLESNQKEEVTPSTPSQIHHPLHVLPPTTQASSIISPTPTLVYHSSPSPDTYNNTILSVPQQPTLLPQTVDSTIGANSVVAASGDSAISLSEASASFVYFIYYYYYYFCGFRYVFIFVVLFCSFLLLCYQFWLTLRLRIGMFMTYLSFGCF
jgi:hypothetical protein